MADIFTREHRSRVMAAIKGRGNSSTETRFVTLMKGAGITGWRRHVPMKIHLPRGTAVRRIPLKTTNMRPAVIRPDFIFRELRLAVFIDGCFWHRCPTHFSAPQDNAQFWESKLSSNVRRDKNVGRALKAKGWHVLRFWEHELQAPAAAVRKLKRALAYRWVIYKSNRPD